jgi:histidine ammonia-lyase
MKLKIDGKSLTLEKIDFFLKENPTVELTAEAKKKVNKARALVEKWVAEDKVVYGVTTGFGEFANVKISKEEDAQLQENLIVSHATGVGENLPPFIREFVFKLCSF